MHAQEYAVPWLEGSTDLESRQQVRAALHTAEGLQMPFNAFRPQLSGTDLPSHP